MKKVFNLENASENLAKIYLEGKEEKAIIDSIKFIARMCYSGASYKCIDKFCHMMTDKGVKLLLSSGVDYDFYLINNRKLWFKRTIAQVSVPEDTEILEKTGILIDVPEYTVDNLLYVGIAAFMTAEVEFDEL